MAQAARLNLRMQKELKLLLTDPPPGASFPTLSDHHHCGGGGGEFSLTSIDALLQGPEGTVYSNGFFKIKIQIPERYPFQPPIVTFATPIYHPNIDNGGRICLDILNLPPKGMWQPSLNISTVLTSIGLLLSEPNPDDGLMHEASRDYKYNRQAFDQNARSMTEKYAQAGVTDIARGENGSQIQTGRSISQTEMQGSIASVCISEHRKLSLESPGCSNNRRDYGEEISKATIHTSAQNHVENGSLKETSKDLSKYTGNFGKLYTTKLKLSPKVPVVSHSRDGESGDTSMSNECSSVLQTQTTSDSPESMLVQVGKIASTRDEDHVKNGSLKETSKDLSKYTGNFGKLYTTQLKLSPKVPVVFHSRDSESGDTSMSNECSSVLQAQTTSDSPESVSVQVGKIASTRDEDHAERSHSISVVGKELHSLHRVTTNLGKDSDEKLQSIPQCTVSQLGSFRSHEGSVLSHNTDHSKTNPPKDAISRKGYCSSSIRLKRRGLVGLMPSSKPSGHPQNHLMDDKENLPPLRCLSPQETEHTAVSAMISAVRESGNKKEQKTVVAAPKLSTAVKFPLEPLNQLQGNNSNVILHTKNPSSPHLKSLHPSNDISSGKKQYINQNCDAVIVLDSEDSDDENVPVRSKLSLRCLSRKRKSGF